MNVWCNPSTIFNRRDILRFAGILTVCVALITTLFFSISTNAAPGVNQTISFQGRILGTNGNPVPDGYYNIQFKIYQDGTGTTAGNTNGSLLWTETYVNNGGNNAVYIKNGYMSVNLGSQNPFGSSIDWNQDTLWLSMNIAGSSTSCSTFGTAPCVADGEMLPMKRLTSTPYALNAGQVGGKTVDQLLHIGTTQQTGDFNISGTGIAGVLQGSTSVATPKIDTISAGALTIGESNATSITIGNSTSNQTIAIGTGSGDTTLALGSNSGASSVTIQGGSNGIALNSEGDVSLSIGSSGAFTISNSDEEEILSLQGDGSALFSGGVVSKTGVGAISADGQTSTSISSSDGGTGTVATTGDTLQLQAGSVPLTLLTAINNNGVANIGIGNAASNGFALDVSGQINASDSFLINGVSVLNNTSLDFSGSSTSTITAGEGQVLQLNADGGVKIGDNSGDPTLFTLDQSASTPTQTGEGVLGSMYYDTTIGKVQCYEADGWGDCSASPDNFVTLSPEYTNAVTNGTGTGTFTSDICSDTLNINDGSASQPTICGTNETYNFYNWTTTETTAQTKDIYVTYQLPSNFTGFVEGSTSLIGRTDSSDAIVSYQVYKNTTSGLVACGSSVQVSTGAQTTWQKATATSTADPANCNFASTDSVVFKITLSSTYDTVASNAYASTLSFAFSND